MKIEKRAVTETRNFYIADDGTEFVTEADCVSYEGRVKLEKEEKEREKRIAARKPELILSDKIELFGITCEYECGMYLVRITSQQDLDDIGMILGYDYDDLYINHKDGEVIPGYYFAECGDCYVDFIKAETLLRNHSLVLSSMMTAMTKNNVPFYGDK